MSRQRPWHAWVSARNSPEMSAWPSRRARPLVGLGAAAATLCITRASATAKARIDRSVARARVAVDLNRAGHRYGKLQIRRLDCGGLEYPALLKDIDSPGDHEDSNDY